MSLSGKRQELVLETRDQDLLVFIDETGHEELSPGGGLFGLGGIVVYGADYLQQVAQPWAALRQSIGVAKDTPFHASMDKSIYLPKVGEIAAFFRAGVFVRHACMVTLVTETNLTPFVTAAVSGLFRSVGRVLASVSQQSRVERVVYVVEHSTRLQPQYQQLVGEKGPALMDERGNRQRFPHVWAALRKSACEPGLEVSDFVLHAAQGYVRAKLQGEPTPSRADFDCVFKDLPHGLVEYLELDKVEATPTNGPRGLFRVPIK